MGPSRPAAETNVVRTDAAATRLLARVEESFHGAYLTLLSIVQGVAFAYLIQQWPDRGDPFLPHQWVLFLVAASFITLAWQEYLIGATMFAWVPTIIDSAVPFGLGALEAVVAASIDVSLSRYVAACGALCVGGVAAYSNYYYQARRGLGDSPAHAQLFRGLHRSGLIILLLSCLYYLALWIWIYNSSLTSTIETRIALLCAVPPIAMLSRIPRYWNRVVHTVRRGEINATNGRRM